MREGQYNIASGLPESKYKDFRKDAINCILATDMAKHGDIVTKFKAITETFSYEDESHRKLVGVFNCYSRALTDLTQPFPYFTLVLFPFLS